jgi:hypothetical protein
MKVSSRHPLRVIEVQVGPDLKQPFAIRGTITRVGSHPDCDLRLSSAYASPHLVSLECRGSDLWIHNRSEQIVTIGDRQLPDGEAAPWRPGEIARLNAWVSLRLPAAVRSDQASPRPTDHASKGPGGYDADSNRPSQKSNQAARDMVSMMASGLLIITLAWSILGADRSDGAPDAAELARIIQAAHGDETTNHTPNPLKIELSLQIQNARTADLRGAPERANHIYGEIRDVLLSLRSPEGGFSDPWFHDAFAFVRKRLEDR